MNIDYMNKEKVYTKFIYVNILALNYFLFFPPIAAPAAHGSSVASDWIQATAITCTTAVAMPDPLTHCTSLGIEPMPP